jgi:DnaJ-class molecular chaperone
MSDRTPLLGPGTTAAICRRCEGDGWVEDSRWPSGRDVCPTCLGRRVVASNSAEICRNPPIFDAELV